MGQRFHFKNIDLKSKCTTRTVWFVEKHQNSFVTLIMNNMHSCKMKILNTHDLQQLRRR